MSAMRHEAIAGVSGAPGQLLDRAPPPVGAWRGQTGRRPTARRGSPPEVFAVQSSKLDFRRARWPSFIERERRQRALPARSSGRPHGSRGRQRNPLRTALADQMKLDQTLPKRAYAEKQGPLQRGGPELHVGSAPEEIGLVGQLTEREWGPTRRRGPISQLKAYGPGRLGCAPLWAVIAA